MVTPLDVNALINMLLPIVMMVMIVSLFTSLIKEFKGI